MLLALCMVQHAAALEITFKSKASVTGSEILLGDIVIFDSDTEMTRALSSLFVSPASAPGERKSLRSLSVKNYLVSSQSLPRDIFWTGSPTVQVMRLGQTIGPERIRSIIDAYIDSSRDLLPEAEIKFTPRALVLPFILPAGELTTEVIPSNPGIIRSSRFSIIFRQEEKVVKNMSVRGKVTALAPIAVSACPLKKGQTLKAEHLLTRVMDISTIRNPELNLKSLVGKRLIRSLRGGSPVLRSQVEAVPVVHKGDRVKIVINSGPLRLTASGLARNDGTVNEMIRVQNSSSNKIVHCRVTGPGRVEVIL